MVGSIARCQQAQLWHLLSEHATHANRNASVTCPGWLLGVLMKARQLIQKASYDPAEVKALGQAFDDAWERLAPSISSRPEAINAARLKLADTILDLAKHDVFDPKWLADAAFQIMHSQASRFRP